MPRKLSYNGKNLLEIAQTCSFSISDKIKDILTQFIPPKIIPKFSISHKIASIREAAIQPPGHKKNTSLTI